MTTPAKLYVSGIKKKLKNYFAAWLPNEPLKLGDVGVLEDGFFSRLTSLTNLKIPFNIRSDVNSTPIDIVSQSDVALTFKLKGETNSALPNIPQEKAGLAIDLSREGAFVVKAPASYEPSIEDILNVETHILDAVRKGTWDKRWTVIIRRVETPLATILISVSSNSRIELEVEGDVPAGGLDIANASLKLGIKYQKGDMIKFIHAQNISPFFQLARIKSRLFGPLGVTHRLSADQVGGVSLKNAEGDPDISRFLYLDLVSDEEY